MFAALGSMLGSGVLSGVGSILGKVGSFAGGLGSLAGGVKSLFGGGSDQHHENYMQRYFESLARQEQAADIPKLAKLAGVSPLAMLGQTSMATPAVPLFQPKDTQWLERAGQGISQGLLQMAQIREIDSKTKLNEALATKALNETNTGTPTPPPVGDQPAPNLLHDPQGASSGKLGAGLKFKPTEIPPMSRTQLGGFIQKGVLPEKMWTVTPEGGYKLRNTEQVKEMVEDMLFDETDMALSDIRRTVDNVFQRGVRPSWSPGKFHTWVYEPVSGWMARPIHDDRLTRTPRSGKFKRDIPIKRFFNWLGEGGRAQ